MIYLTSEPFVIAERLARSSSSPLSSWKVGDVIVFRTTMSSPGSTTRGGSMSKVVFVVNKSNLSVYASTLNKVPGVMARAFRLEPQEEAAE